MPPEHLQHIMSALNASPRLWNWFPACLRPPPRKPTERASKFEGVPPARRYQVVAVKVEDDEPIVITGLTPKLGPQQRATLNLSENDPWTAADPLLNYK